MGLGEKGDPAESVPEAEASRMSLLTGSFRGVYLPAGHGQVAFAAGCVDFKAFFHPWPGKVERKGNCLMCSYLKLTSSPV